MTTRSQRDLLVELEPTAEALMSRHLGMTREWFPHDYIPYSLGRDYDKEPWTPDQPRISGVAQIAFEVNLLTEDNLPSYHREIYRQFARGDGAWINWVHRWTAEEGRHAIVLRDYLVVTRNIDPVALERARMQQIQIAYDHPDDGNVLRGLAYVAFQELATRVSHRNTGRYSSDPVADRIMARIAADENLHMVFYRDMLSEAAKLDPSGVVEAVAAEVIEFKMPGAGMAQYRRKAAQMANAGIYDLRIHHDEIIWPLLRHWGIFEMEGLTQAAEEARQRLSHFVGHLDVTASRFEARRAMTREQEAILAD